MGVPKFFRWLSERYPRINQRFGSLPKTETSQRYFDGRPPPPIPAGEAPDPLSMCGLPPPVDRLYLDMNGIIHGCSHNNSDEETAAGSDESIETGTSNRGKPVTRKEIFRNVCYYLDRVIGDIVEPTELVYMAIDGVAPRAKLNQQRSRRYRSGTTDGEIETNIYEAHAKVLAERRARKREEGLRRQGEDDLSIFLSMMDHTQSTFSRPKSNQEEEQIKEVTPGRFKGKFQANAHGETENSLEIMGSNADQEAFHSNIITPGTSFFQEFSRHLEHFIQYKITTDPKWQKLKIIFSGPNVPGEGEHKIMDFIRNEKRRPDYNPNLRHCIMGQDGDLVMLGLATHEPNLVLLRERVVFSMAKQKLANAHYNAQGNGSLDIYLHNAHFEFLHMGVLRDYIAYEFETSNVLHESPFDLEHTIDDFVFLTFFVGNDFLPHMPALDIADDAFDLLFFTYKTCRQKWHEEYVQAMKRGESPTVPYLTNAGNLVSGSRLEDFLSKVGSHEVAYYDKKKQTANVDQKKMKRVYKKFGMNSNLPNAEVVASKEESDRIAYRQMIIESGDTMKSEMEAMDAKATGVFSPVMTGVFQPVGEELEEGLISRMGSLLQNSLSNDENNNDVSDRWDSMGMDDQDLKGRYYYDKFEFTPFDEAKHLDLRKAYIEGLVWNLKYYYEGCPSWDWYFPYHYGPMLSDLVNLDEILNQINFDDPGKPLKPFEQLMGCMPPSQAKHLPKPYRWLMTEPDSPIIDFYPRSFTVDMNGKRWPWEAVALLPFIDSNRLLDATSKVDESQLTKEERSRNSTCEAVVFMYDSETSNQLQGIADTEGLGPLEDNKAKIIPFSGSELEFKPAENPVLEPRLVDGVQIPMPGYGTLRDAPVQSMMRKRLGIDVFSTRSRYQTSCLEMSNTVPPLESMESLVNLAPELIGTLIFVNYPYFLEGLVTAVSNEQMTVRGSQNARSWSHREVDMWKARRDGAVRQFLTGEGVTGTGGIVISDEQPITLSIRPIEKVVVSQNGEKVKTYAKFELEVPLECTFWAPSAVDQRLDIPSRLEKNVFEVAASTVTRLPLPNTDIPTGRRTLFPPRHLPTGKSSMLNYSTSRSSGQRRSFSVGSLLHCTPRTILPVGSNKAQSFAKPLVVTTRIPKSRGILILAGTVFASFVAQFGAATTVLNETPYHHFRTYKSKVISAPMEIRSTDLREYDRIIAFRGGYMDQSSPPPLDFAHGTTTLSFVFNGGIVTAVDSRASLGSFVGSKTVQKVLPVSSHILGTMAGGAADCAYWIRHLKTKAILQELQEGQRMTVARASRLLSNTLFEQRGQDLSVGTMIMGYDEEGPPRLFYVDDSGKRIEGNMFSVGSGSTFALGILDTEYRYELSEDEAIALGIKAIRHATFRDAFSGGFINVYLITKGGWKKVYSEDIARGAEY